MNIDCSICIVCVQILAFYLPTWSIWNAYWFENRWNCHDKTVFEHLLRLDGTGDKIANGKAERRDRNHGAEEARGSCYLRSCSNDSRTAKILSRHPFLKYILDTRSQRGIRRVINGNEKHLDPFLEVRLVVCRRHAIWNTRYQIDVIRLFRNFHRKRPSRIPRRLPIQVV